ncbi:MAG: hypothetical protein JSV31_10730, partial [Desulfobacterales bacterium]
PPSKKLKTDGHLIFIKFPLQTLFTIFLIFDKGTNLTSRKRNRHRHGEKYGIDVRKRASEMLVGI